MKKSLTKHFLSLLFVLAVAMPAFAGSERYASKEVAPAPPVCDWSGFYIGLNVGATNYTARFNDDDYFNGFGTNEWDTGAFMGGGQAGYNLQFGQLVLGVEIDASGSTAEIDKTLYSGYEHNYGKVDLLTTFRGRLGVAFDKALVFVSAGGALAHGDWRDSYTYPGQPADFYYNAYWKGEDWRWGWTGGAGIEYMFNCNWSIRAEALYTWLEEDTTDITTPPGGYYENSSYRYTFDDDLWTYRVGVNYKFGSFFHH